ncbi:MAG: hypothetical protein Q9220_001389 [cf. Caloplaca sp. 1 TL-2023]
MPPSQLKKLKTKLREQGITGPQKSKKQKKQARTSGSFQDSRIQRNAALNGIREQFNPFEIRAPGRPSKYDVATAKAVAQKSTKNAVARPGVTKGFGEESRRQTLLKEMQRRKKVGGILDRRFGENDPKMTPEEKALERFVKEKQRGSKKDTLFDLEDGDEGEQLTHFGQSLSFEKPTKVDDFQEVGLSSEDESDSFDDSERPSKRRRLSEDADFIEEALSRGDDDELARPKTKKEVMEEVIAKSKLHKYERQQAKEDDDDLRAELDKGMPDLLAMMRGNQKQPLLPQGLGAPNGNMNPDRAAMLDGKDRAQAEKEYDERLRQMTFDQRSKPADRTLTEEERLEKEARRLKELEAERLRRMKGEQDNDDSEHEQDQELFNGAEDAEEQEQDPFGLGSGLAGRKNRQMLEVEDEDQFVLEDDLVASGSELEPSEGSLEDQSEGQASDEEDREFVSGLLSEGEASRPQTSHDDNGGSAAPSGVMANGLAYTYPCPQSLEEMLQTTKGVPINDQPTMVQRIRALFHPKLQPGNKDKLAIFSSVLVDYVSYLGNNVTRESFAVLEGLIRHVHSLAKMFPEEVGRAFRAHLKSLVEERPLDPKSGDLIILTAIGSIFPTSDHFHQIVTPAMLCMGQCLGQRVPRKLSDLATGVYLCTMCLQYQRLSKRYIPELLNYTLNALYALAPIQAPRITGFLQWHNPPGSFRLKIQSDDQPRQLTFWDTVPTVDIAGETNEELKLALLNALLTISGVMADLWADKTAFNEIFNPISACLTHLTSKPCASKIGTPLKEKAQETQKHIQDLLQQARKTRRPLLLHNHRPLPIKTSIPKFEESYNPDKHYDPDRDRAESNKLKAEHKKERKGALRELRKDANFIARESLREKKERDAQYEKKFKRLVAEIQGEEGREAKNYEREKRMRKGRK